MDVSLVSVGLGDNLKLLVDGGATSVVLINSILETLNVMSSGSKGMCSIVNDNTFPTNGKNYVQSERIAPSSYLANKCSEKPKLLSTPNTSLPSLGMDAPLAFFNRGSLNPSQWSLLVYGTCLSLAPRFAHIQD